MNNWDLLFLHQEQYVTYFKAGVHVNFTKFKEGLEGKKNVCWNTTTQLNAPERAPQVGG